MNAIIYPIFTHSNDTSNITNEGFLSVMLAFITLGILLCIGSLIYSIFKAKISIYWDFNWVHIRAICRETICFYLGLFFIFLPTLLILLVLITCYIYQIFI